MSMKTGVLVGLLALSMSGAAAAAPVMSAPLPNVPGKRISANLVQYGPGEGSPSHTHNGASVLAYVIAGKIRSALDNEEPRVYSVGEYFFEKPGQTHRVSENASKTEPASLLAVLIADDGAPATTPTAPPR